MYILFDEIKARECVKHLHLKIVFTEVSSLSFRWKCLENLESFVSQQLKDCGRTAAFLRLKPSLCPTSNFIMQILHWKHE